MGRKGKSGKLPPWWKGAKLYDAIDGAEIFDYESSTTTQRGLKMHKKNFDSLTDDQREEAIKRRMR